jgi:hypothetical protein
MNKTRANTEDRKGQNKLEVRIRQREAELNCEIGELWDQTDQEIPSPRGGTRCEKISRRPVVLV